MCGVSLDIAAGRVLGCRCVLAGGAAAEPGRVDGVVPAVGAQPAAPDHGCVDGEGDSQLRPGGEGGPGRAGPAGRLDLPGSWTLSRPWPPRAGPRWRWWTPTGWAEAGCWTGCGNGSGSAPRSAGSPSTGNSTVSSP